MTSPTIPRCSARSDLATILTGSSFLMGALLYWGGWMLLPRHIGTFLAPSDFAAIHETYHLWIWTFRSHLFGMVFVVISLVAFGTSIDRGPARALFWPGIAVACAGTFVAALGAAFYYHFGAWGAVDLHGKSAPVVAQYVDSLRMMTEYVTCLVRFGRVFPGVGFVLIGVAIMRWRPVPGWLGMTAVVMGVLSMGITMGLPNDLDAHRPAFHLQTAWLAAMGAVLLRLGTRPCGNESSTSE